MSEHMVTIKIPAQTAGKMLELLAGQDHCEAESIAQAFKLRDMLDAAGIDRDDEEGERADLLARVALGLRERQEAREMVEQRGQMLDRLHEESTKKVFHLGHELERSRLRIGELEATERRLRDSLAAADSTIEGLWKDVTKATDAAREAYHAAANAEEREEATRQAVKPSSKATPVVGTNPPAVDWNMVKAHAEVIISAAGSGLFAPPEGQGVHRMRCWEQMEKLAEALHLAREDGAQEKTLMVLLSESIARETKANHRLSLLEDTERALRSGLFEARGKIAELEGQLKIKSTLAASLDGQRRDAEEAVEAARQEMMALRQDYQASRKLYRELDELARAALRQAGATPELERFLEEHSGKLSVQVLISDKTVSYEVPTVIPSPDQSGG